ncbi:FtsB family cell division protein [Cesiribacter andamanensis]|uniref:Septum formation initiator n=1 Tax=Cesiribacter andamanensis AMV16 TaxID=1279009 RepID=M7N9Y5_9BACT|nr:septum formation initiator family protein [Cesiribacter andamanensis]EMR04021.1 Septum formation initiator [Cesiribacter andamanensis AMV16]
MSPIRKIPPIFRNIYVLAALGYLVWMLFLDANNIPNQIRTSAKMSRLEDDKAHYQQRIEEVKKDREELLGDPAMLEKFAREKYLMRKPQEVVYVLERENED